MATQDKAKSKGFAKGGPTKKKWEEQPNRKIAGGTEYCNNRFYCKTLVVDKNLVPKPVFAFSGKDRFQTTTQIAKDDDIIIKRYIKTNDVVIEGAGFTNKQDILNKIAPEVYKWLLDNDTFKLCKGPWFDGTVTEAGNFYKRKLCNLLRGVAYPEIIEILFHRKHINMLPSWKDSKPLPSKLEGALGQDTYYFIFMSDSTVERIVFQEHLCFYNNEEPLLLDQGLDISTLNNGNSNIYNIIKVVDFGQDALPLIELTAA